jgi:hypothetical protein
MAVHRRRRRSRLFSQVGGDDVIAAICDQSARGPARSLDKDAYQRFSF